ncbi:MAG: hypothetical protein Q9219_004212 [cf. Caloplaca sp. 3 TL-2023]
MADLDAELLALAGGDSSDEEGSKPSNTANKVRSPNSPPQPSNGNKIPSSKRGIAQRSSTRAAGSASRSKKLTRNDSEEGEASSIPSSPNSLQSAPMSESESESSPAMDEGVTDFPIEGKFKSEKDRAEIMSLSEIQRESILAERAQQREREVQNEHLRRLVASKKKEAEAVESKKRKLDPADSDDRQRKSSRQKTALGGRKAGETSGAIEAYKRQREEKGLRDEQRKRDGQERRDRKARGSVEDMYSDADADGESDVDWSDVRKHTDEVRRQEDDQPADQRDFERVRIGRENFARVCFTPGFENAIKDCYVRVNIGQNPTTGEPIYRMAKIEGFDEGRPYAMEGVNNKNFVTTQYAKLSIGKSSRKIPFIICSSAKFTEVDFNDYKKQLLADDLALPTKPTLVAKIADINKLINHQFTAEEIQQKLERSGVLQQRFATIERTSLLDRRRKAEARGDEAAVTKCNEALAELNGPKLAFGTSLYKEQPKSANAGPTQQERLAELNRANRKANTEEVRKAQRAERRAEAIARRAIERGEAVADRFARVKTRPRTTYDASEDHLAPPKPVAKGVDDLFDGGSKDNSRGGSRASTPMQTPAVKKGTPTPQPPQQKVNGLPKVGRRNMDDEVIGAMDFDIDIDI